MRAHIRDDEWIDVLDGIAEPALRRHLEECGACRSTADGMLEVLETASATEVPEPSPLFWDSFRTRVGEAIAAPPAPRARWTPALLGWPLAAAASLVVALSVYTGGVRTPAAVPTAAPTLAAWSPLPATDDDESLPVLAAAASASDDLAAQDCAGVSSCLLDLSEDESAGLAEALRVELSAGRS
jgi:hypothetical protein